MRMTQPSQRSGSNNKGGSGVAVKLVTYCSRGREVGVVGKLNLVLVMVDRPPPRMGEGGTCMYVVVPSPNIFMIN